VGVPDHSLRVMSIRLIVRFDSNHGIPIDVNPSMSVEDLKKLIAQQRGLSPNDVRVIFCGRELQNHMTIKDYEFDRQSIVHVVRGRSSVRSQRDINLGGVGDHLGMIAEDDERSLGPRSLPGLTLQSKILYWSIFSCYDSLDLSGCLKCWCFRINNLA
jgi:hypothetical protein